MEIEKCKELYEEFSDLAEDIVRVRLNTKVFHCGIYVPEGTEAEVLLSDLTYVDCEGRGKTKLTVKFDGFEGKLCRCEVDETKSSLFIWTSWIDVIDPFQDDLISKFRDDELSKIRLIH